jgi:SAM-dependent methyltransferase
VDVTNRYVLDFARRHGGRILDYGCGAGQVVLAGRQAGLDIYGADVFYEGAATRPPASEFISPITAGRIPFPNAHFDLVTDNQVMEHVADLDAVLGEIHRVLKPGGTMLSLFPAVDVWREGHIGIPFAHWFRKGSRSRYYYTWALSSLGVGTWKDQAPADKLEWIDRWTCYRSRKQIFRAYDRYFTSQLIEPDYIRYRLLDQPTPVRRLAVRFASLGAPLFRKLAFLVIRSRAN